jgi:hypothetical protein
MFSLFLKIEGYNCILGGEIGGTIGDWELMSVAPCTELSVRAGYGASRKISFLHPDIAAIPRYDLRILPDSCQLLINDRYDQATVLYTYVSEAQFVWMIRLHLLKTSWLLRFAEQSARLVEIFSSLLFFQLI